MENEHLVGFDAIEDFEESPTAAAAAEFALKQSWDEFVHDKTHAEIVRRENEERKVATKISTRKIRKYWKSYCRT